jgi:hypothetical protein
METPATVARLAPVPALDPRRWWALAVLLRRGAVDFTAHRPADARC